MCSALRCFLIAAVLAVCLSPLHLRAQEASSACQIGEAAPLAGLFLAAAGPVQPSKRINPKILCGGAGQTCCVGGTCNSGLACNANGFCRACGDEGNICCTSHPKCASGLACTNGRCAAPTPPPCGGVNQACCSGGTCNTLGLACNLTNNQCQPCGYYGTYCCPYTPTCFEGSCQVPGVCKP
jgi:hypothetical protein